MGHTHFSEVYVAWEQIIMEVDQFSEAYFRYRLGSCQIKFHFLREIDRIYKNVPCF